MSLSKSAMDVDSEPLSSQDNVEDPMMTSMEENVNCTCDCGGSSSKCVTVTADDIINQTFETSDAAYNLYVRYARCLGFGVRKGDTAREKDGTQRRRRFFCSKEGKRAEKYISSLSRKREHRALTRTGCEAMLAVYLDTKTSTWRVKKLVEKHNHDLVPQCLVHLIPNHRGLTEPQKAQANTMHDHGLPTSKIMGLMVGQAGGYANVGFTKKDLDNHFQRARRAMLIGGDSNATISYLLGKTDVDPMAMTRYSATDEGRLANLFWADGICRSDYQCFGDVLAFDTTYRKNKYRRPLVIFSGCNHHRQTCIFGFALVEDERTATYTWLLQNFLEVMLNKSPSVVVTDGDEAMKAAIREIFPDATHRLCGWHIQKNVTANTKNKNFSNDFRRCLYAPWHPEEFEEYWENMIKKYGLEENEWVLSEYEKRKSWASAYLRDKFCAGFRTTSRCEAINNFIKRFIGIRQSLLELVQNLEHALMDYRNNELVSQFKTLYGEPVLTTGLEALELSAANFYTREILGEVKKEIQGVVALDVINEENISTTVVLKVKECDRRQHTYIVLYDRNTKHMECECSRWSSEGIPCRHMFCAMKRVGLQKLPDSLLLRRWSKDAKKYLDESSAGGTTQDREREFLMRYGALSVAATWMVFLGAQDGPSFHDTMNEVCRWTQTLEQKSDLKRQTTDSTTPNFVGDPSVVKTKGAPKGKKERGKRRCTKCNSAGHVKNKCPVRNDGDDLGDKTGNGAQASFGTKEKLPKDPMASQETLAVPNTEVNVPVQQESGLGDSGLINGHENPIPPYGSHQWLLQVVQQGHYSKFNGMQ
nr:protein FAR1-RELATED SEQUENCE 5-like isoform X2 [Arachis hypogaea]XP_029145486.1 protein FAR1-RELATED SEQUENCE 5-like isoform X2 [Arachis hypogaea]XP_029145487.1 protein FAR1-RELATED SEQUENCE 5-like isoform X2 [Arachis hypogaea]